LKNQKIAFFSIQIIVVNGNLHKIANWNTKTERRGI